MDKKFLLACDVILMLPGWKKSTGACMEHTWAQFEKNVNGKSIRIIYLPDNWTPCDIPSPKDVII